MINFIDSQKLTSNRWSNQTENIYLYLFFNLRNSVVHLHLHEYITESFLPVKSILYGPETRTFIFDGSMTVISVRVHVDEQMAYLR